MSRTSVFVTFTQTASPNFRPAASSSASISGARITAWTIGCGLPATGFGRTFQMGAGSATLPPIAVSVPVAASPFSQR